MLSDSPANQYPHLFQEALWPWGPTRARFRLLDKPPPAGLIANVNIVPRLGDRWVIIQLSDGVWEMPGGTVEPDEGYLETVRRELLEEVGARLISFRPFGAWHCYTYSPEPFRPHLPFPEYYRLVGWGDIELIGAPANPPDGEQVMAVAAVPLATAVVRFAAARRDELAELYQLAAATAR